MILRGMKGRKFYENDDFSGMGSKHHVGRMVDVVQQSNR